MIYFPDKKDKKIIEILREHAEYTTRQIAKKTLLPITTIHNRIKKLKKEGIIKKYTIEVDHKKLDQNLISYILISVNLETLKEKKKSQEDVLKDIKKHAAVQRVDIVSGGTDIIALVRSKDIDAYNDFLLKKIQTIDGIKSTQTFFVIREG